MIEKMQKASLLLLDSKRRDALEQLRELGVLHVQVETAESDTLERLRGEQSVLTRALRAMEIHAAESMNEEQKRPDSRMRERAIQAAEHVTELDESYREHGNRLEQLSRERESAEPWGDFEPGELTTLFEHGVRIRFHVLPRKSFERRRPVNAYLISMREANAYFVTVEQRSSDAEEEPAASEISAPPRSLSDIDADIAALRGEQQACVNEIAQHAAQADELRAVLSLVNEELEFHRVNESMGREEQICYISGFVPESLADKLREAASENGWGLLLREPAEEDNVPTRIKNPKPIAIIRPVFNLLETIPGYREFDISFWFLLFFSVFVAIIIGDAAYGLIVVALAALLIARSKTGIQPGHVLIAVLGICTVAWGAMTGTWFGYEPFSRLPLLSTLIVEPISSYNPASEDNVKWLCFILATVHLSIAHLWSFGRLLREREPLAGISHLGWLSLVLGLYYLVLNVVLARPLEQFSLYMIGGGFAAVVLFGRQAAGVGFFRGVGRGLANIFPTALDSISAFSDIISYIRLFAVGLATLAIAQSFNDMALGLADGGGFGIVASVLVLFLGHTLNLLMAGLAVIVHGVRLNMLEFSRHMGMEWSGVAYDPFQKRVASGQ